MNRLRGFAILALAASAVFAQTTHIVGTTIVGGDNAPLQRGEITMQPTDANGNPLNVNLGSSGGLMVPRAAVCLVANGAITTALNGTACTVLDTTTTNPLHFCYKTTILDAVTGWAAPVMPCVQPSGSTWSFDTYVPPAAPTALIAEGPAGPAGPTGPTGSNGSATVSVGTTTTGAAGSSAAVANTGSSTAAVLNFTVPQGPTGATGATGPQGPAGSSSGGSITGLVSDGANGIAVTGNVGSAKSSTSLSPVCDVRSEGAVINGTTDIYSAVQACISNVDSVYGGTGIVRLPCVRAGSTGPGCYLQNFSLLTGPSAGMVKFELQGGLQVGSTLVLPGWASLFGDAGGAPQQFQDDTVPATIFGPMCTGTLGTAITAANTATNITPTFSGTVYGGGPSCGIANLPVGAAFTGAALASVSATATRVIDAPVGFSKVTLSFSTPLRIPPGENISVTGCSDSSVNVSNIPVASSDYTAQTVTFFVTTTTNTTATGCTATGFNEDKFESIRILCSNGVGGTFNGVNYNSCGSGQVTVMSKHTHLSTDQWGEVAAGPAFNTYGSQTWSDLTIEQCAGACFWAEGSTNLTLNNISTQAWPYLTSVATELSSNYFSHISGGYFQESLNGAGSCPSGGCSQPSYPSALLCNSDASVGGYYSHSVDGCDRTTIDKTWFFGNIKITGDGVNQLVGFPIITYPDFEEVFGNVISVDNRNGIQTPNCLSLTNLNTQDNISLLNQPEIGYTDGGLPPSGCVQTYMATLYGNPVTNSYFNGNLTDTETQSAIRAFPPNGSASSGVYNEGNLLAGEIENESASFPPSILPYGSLPMASDTVAAWSGLCASASCTATAAVGPDGPAGSMAAAEIDTSVTGTNISIGTWTGATYPGDHFIIGSWVRPGLNEVHTAGSIGGVIGNGNSFFIQSDDSNEFTPTQNVGSLTNTCAPGAFGTGLYSNGWSPEVAICTVSTGSSTSHNIHFELAATNGGSGTAGNQTAEPFWAFIPGPNNPACTAAGTCNLTADQIEEARRDQYHGCVPPGMPAGSVATCETVKVSGPATAPSGSCSTNGIWVFSQDGHGTVCLSGTWTAKI